MVLDKYATDNLSHLLLFSAISMLCLFASAQDFNPLGDWAGCCSPLLVAGFVIGIPHVAEWFPAEGDWTGGGMYYVAAGISARPC